MEYRQKDDADKDKRNPELISFPDKLLKFQGEERKFCYQ